jgi:hypothetical protein
LRFMHDYTIDRCGDHVHFAGSELFAYAASAKIRN